MLLSYHDAVHMLWSGLGTKKHLVKVQKTLWLGLKSVLVATNTTRDGPEISFKISGGVTLTKM